MSAFGPIYSGTFRPRMEVNGKPLRESLHALTGKSMMLRHAWTQSENDIYPGEMALMPADKETNEMLDGVFHGWFASGDFENLELVEDEDP